MNASMRDMEKQISDMEVLLKMLLPLAFFGIKKKEIKEIKEGIKELKIKIKDMNDTVTNFNDTFLTTVR